MFIESIRDTQVEGEEGLEEFHQRRLINMEDGFMLELGTKEPQPQYYIAYIHPLFQSANRPKDYYRHSNYFCANSIKFLKWEEAHKAYKKIKKKWVGDKEVITLYDLR